MIVDFHTHIFPPDVADNRDAYVAADATFSTLYGSPKAHIASAEDLIASMDEAGIDASVALGFAWRDLDHCRRHNDYLLEAASQSAGRIIAFCTLPLAAGPDAVAAEARRCIECGARGFGELRPDSVAVDLDPPEMSQALQYAGAGGPLLFHVTEPVGHAYPGKEGFALDAFYRFVVAHPGLRVIGAHWGGGLPFYALMPEVKLALEHAAFDTAGTSLLYDASVYRRGVDSVGAGHVLFGSDFPLLRQGRSRRRIEEDAGLTDEEIAAVLGGNAARLLRFP